MRRLFSLFVLIIVFQFNSYADEGMWIPMYLGELNEAEMQAMGMKITASDIYDVNQASLKDAIVLFGRGCTAEVVSEEGLILTNHHCGYGRIQAHSSVENDYLTDGFWAMDKTEELPNPGLSVTLLVEMRDVTDLILEGITDEMNEIDRSLRIRENISKVSDSAVKDSHYEAIIKPFFQGNQYFMFINEVFRDIRLVGAPPSNIGKFGGDTDNWVWPRHTGDFSIFRIYANKDNQPAEYAEDNVPYKPKKYIPISLNGVEEGDFTFVFGYPGRTEEYITSDAIKMKTEVVNPVRISLRGKRIDIFNKYMNENKEYRIQYSAKQARIANGWKKWIGENRGIKRLKTIEEKQEFENIFQDWADSDEALKLKYGELLNEFKDSYEKLSPLEYNTAYITEAGLGIELLKYARSFRYLVAESKDKETPDADIQAEVEGLLVNDLYHFKNYQQKIDKEVFVAMMSDYMQNVDADHQPEEVKVLVNDYDDDYHQMAVDIFSKSNFVSKEKVNALLKNYKRSHYKKIEKDPAYQLATYFAEYYNKELVPGIVVLSAKKDSLMRVYMKAQMEMQHNKKFYPDANLTLRVAYGHVGGFQPDDAVTYKHYTTLEGIMQKENPDIYDYVVVDNLKELYKNKDYGHYVDKDGLMHVCFIASNHTTGGNSGSPVLDAEGNLIGINFDRSWEGTMSDIVYDESQCRNIAIDIRYLLFIVDKLAGAGHLVEEMTIVKN